MVGDGEWVAVVSVAELELALEVGAPEVVGHEAGRERCPRCATARPARHPDQAMPVQHSVDRALGRNPEIAGQPSQKQFADLAGAPMRLVPLGRDDQALELSRQLVGEAHRPARPVGQGLEPMLLVALEDLVAGLARDAELRDRPPSSPRPPKAGRRTAGARPDRTLLPGHPHLPPAGGRCYPCVRHELSPMSRAAQPKSASQNLQLGSVSEAGDYLCETSRALIMPPPRYQSIHAAYH